MPTFSVTEQKILDVLRDGHDHGVDELTACLPDELSDKTVTKVHLHRIRTKLEPIGETILCVWNRRRRLYRHVRLLGGTE